MLLILEYCVQVHEFQPIISQGSFLFILTLTPLPRTPDQMAFLFNKNKTFKPNAKAGYKNEKLSQIAAHTLATLGSGGMQVCAFLSLAFVGALPVL